MVAQVFNPSTGGAEAGLSLSVEGQLGLHSETLFKKGVGGWSLEKKSSRDSHEGLSLDS